MVYFYPRPPRGGRRNRRGRRCRSRGISIHALREEGDSKVVKLCTVSRDFYPRPPRGGRLPSAQTAQLLARNFYPRPPRGGRPALTKNFTRDEFISIHALREEGDALFLHGRAGKGSISIHALREEGDQDAFKTQKAEHQISIHALREEGDGWRWTSVPSASNFYPRPPRGGRLLAVIHALTGADFYPRPPRGGRPSALSRCAAPAEFLSTPSARRATLFALLLFGHILISIHALREEGDLRSCCASHSARSFLSTPSARRATTPGRSPSRPPPRFLSTPSARRATWSRSFRSMGTMISIHALREEGDRLACCGIILA